MPNIGDVLNSLGAWGERPATIVGHGRGPLENGAVMVDVWIETAGGGLIEVTGQVDHAAGTISQVWVRDLTSETAVPLDNSLLIRGNAKDLLVSVGMDDEPVWLP